jgi:hypothetical protein
MLRLAAFGGEFAEVQSIAKGTICCPVRFRARARSNGTVTVGEHCGASQRYGDRQCGCREFPHVFLLVLVELIGPETGGLLLQLNR